MPNEDITDLERHRLQASVATLDRLFRFGPCHAMRARSDLDGPVLLRNADQAETDHNRVRRQDLIRDFGKQRTPVVDVRVLILRPAYRYVASPLVGDDAAVHESAHDGEHVRIEEELRREAWWIERHRQEVSVRSAVGSGPGGEIRVQAWPECRPACVDERRREVAAQNGVALLVDVIDRLSDSVCGRHASRCRSCGEIKTAHRLSRAARRRIECRSVGSLNGSPLPRSR